METNKRILIVSPHPDDETLGVGGSISKFITQGHDVMILTVSGHLPPLYSKEEYEITLKEAYEAYKILGVNKSIFLEIPATMIGEEPVHVFNGKISSVLKEFEPNIVFCPFPDRHIDHRLIFESCMVATRPVGFGKKIEMVAAYETLSETHWNAPYLESNFTPNLVVDITTHLEVKIDALSRFKSQISDRDGPRSLEAVRALAKFRGSQSGFENGEAFYIIKKTL
jgi:LmbE family N-acetylglucosaminyl deacetylase